MVPSKLSPAGDRVATCGWDGSLSLWRTGAEVLLAATEAAGGSEAATSVKKRKVRGDWCGCVAMVAVMAPASKQGARLIFPSTPSGSNPNLSPSASFVKVIRKADGVGSSRVASVSEAPTSRLEGHLHCVSSATWPEAESLYSGGWDHSVRQDVHGRTNARQDPIRWPDCQNNCQLLDFT